MKRGNYGFAEELLFVKKIKGETSPKVSPLDPLMGLGELPQVPPERRVSRNEVVKNAPRGKCALRSAVDRRNCTTNEGISIAN